MKEFIFFSKVPIFLFSFRGTQETKCSISPPGKILSTKRPILSHFENGCQKISIYVRGDGGFSPFGSACLQTRHRPLQTFHGLHRCHTPAVTTLVNWRLNCTKGSQRTWTCVKRAGITKHIRNLLALSAWNTLGPKTLLLRVFRMEFVHVSCKWSYVDMDTILWVCFFSAFIGMQSNLVDASIE